MLPYQRLVEENGDEVGGFEAAVPPESRNQSRELFDEDTANRAHDQEVAAKPWWKANFFVRSPVLFGTWDGVFTTVMINIFGVLIFLRMGWLIGYAGVGVATLIILLTIAIGAITTLSVIGLITRHVQHARQQRTSTDDSLATYDVFSMIGFVLGQRISGPVGLLYAFGHAVAVAMYAVGLGEAISDLFHWSGVWPIRGIALGTVAVMLLVVLAGVRWVVKLQLVLVLVLAVAILDFMVGTLVRHSPSYGVLGYSAALLHNNTASAFSSDVTFFTVFGVFFPTMTGVAGGLNMACDLKTPARSVPVGTVVALIVSGVSWILMAILLGATCTRFSLQTDKLIEYRVSLVGALFLIGLYISSLSSCLAVFYGAPRVLQAMGRSKIVPLLSVIGRGRGPNQEPFVAILVVGFVAFVFVFIGHLNTLALLINMPFLLTYSVLNYAYFSLSMHDDGIACTADSSKPLNRIGSLYVEENGDEDADLETPGRRKSMPNDGVFAGDGLKENIRMMEPGTKDSTVDMGNPFTGAEDGREEDQLLNRSSESAVGPSSTPYMLSGGSDSGELRRRTTAIQQSGGESEHRFPRLRRVQERLHLTREDRVQHEEAMVRVLNRAASRWVSLIGCVLCFVAMFVIHWGYALAAVCLVLLLFIYVGHVNPSLLGGQSAFTMTLWVQQLAWGALARLRPVKSAGAARRSSPSERSLIITQPKVPFDMNIVQLTEENRDYSRRERVHHSVQQSQPGDEFISS